MDNPNVVPFPRQADQVHPADLARAARIRAAAAGRRMESVSERTRVAAAVAQVVEGALAGGGVTKQALYARAGLSHGERASSKAARHYEIPRALMADGADPDALARRASGLTKDPSRYIALLDALSDLTGADGTSLVIRVFGGTSLENVQALDPLDEADQDAARDAVARMLAAGADWVVRRNPRLPRLVEDARRHGMRYDASEDAWLGPYPDPGKPRVDPTYWRGGPSLHLGRVTLSTQPIALALAPPGLLGRDGAGFPNSDDFTAEGTGELAVDAEVWLTLVMDRGPVPAPRLAFALARTSYIYGPEEFVPGGRLGVRLEDMRPNVRLDHWDEEFEVPGGTLLLSPPDEWDRPDAPIDYHARCYGPQVVDADAAGLRDLDSRVVRTHGLTPLHFSGSRMAGCRATGEFTRRIECLLRYGFGPVDPPDAPPGEPTVRERDGVHGPVEHLNDQAAAMVAAMGRYRAAVAAELDVSTEDILASYRPG